MDLSYDAAMRLWELADEHMEAQEFSDAEECLVKVIPMFESLECFDVVARACLQLASVYHLTHELPKAQAAVIQALDSATEADDLEMEGIAQNFAGDLHYFAGEYDKAKDVWKKALVIGEELGDVEMIVESLSGLSNVLTSEDHSEAALNEAEQYLSQAIDLAPMLDKPDMTAENYDSLGHIALERELYSDARSFFQKSLDIADLLKDAGMRSRDNGNVGITYLNEDEFGKAEEYFNKAIEIAEKSGLEELVAANYCNLGDLFTQQKKYDEAEEILNKGLEIARRIQYAHIEECLLLDLETLQEERASNE